MSDTVEYPISSPTTTITFDAVTRISRQRDVTKVFQQGDLDGNGVVETAGTSLLKIKVSFELKSDATTSAIEKWDEFDTLIKDQNDKSMRFSVTYETAIGNKTQTYDGKITGLATDDTEGDPDLVTGTFAMTVETKGTIA